MIATADAPPASTVAVPATPPAAARADYGTRESRRQCLQFVLKNPVAFRERFVPLVSKRGYWQRYSFYPVLFGIEHGDTFLGAGRGSGKSFAFLEPALVQIPISRPGQETMITSLRRIHVTDRMERVIDYFDVPFLRLFRKRILRSPSYHIELHNGHNIYGISVGDDPEARMAQGKHVSFLAIEEAQQYPDRAYMKLGGATDPRGHTKLMQGVPDGRLDTPFRKADDHYESFAGRRFHLSRYLDPYFDRKTKAGFAEMYSGEDHDLYKQEVHALWGSPAWSAWDIDQLYACWEPKTKLPIVVVEVSGKDYKAQNLVPEVVVNKLPGRPRDARVRMSMDVGYSQPSEIGVWMFWAERWWLIARIRLVNRMEHDVQADLLMAIGVLYHAEQVGIDTTDGEGRAIAATLENFERWRLCVVRATFNETHMTGWTPLGEEIWEPMRDIGTTMLRTLFSHHELALPEDADIPEEFIKEKESRTPEGRTRIVTPPDVHIPDMMRVFAFMTFLDHPPVPPEELSAAFCMPVVADGFLWQRGTAYL